MMKTFAGISSKLGLNIDAPITADKVISYLMANGRPDLIVDALSNPDDEVIITPQDELLQRQNIRPMEVRVSNIGRGILPPDELVIKIYR
jgi:hypothetical protein